MVNKCVISMKLNQGFKISSSVQLPSCGHLYCKGQMNYIKHILIYDSSNGKRNKNLMRGRRKPTAKSKFRNSVQGKFLFKKKIFMYELQSFLIK